MLFFNEIKITQFRNYIFQSFSFHEKVIGICGANGSGKTNLLDALYYLCFTKSYFSRNESQNSSHSTLGFRIEGSLKRQNETFELLCIYRENNRKEFLLNNEVYKKFSEHIGQFPCVMIAPDDVSLITGNSDERRKFLDTILAQLHKNYLKNLIDYNKILLQRNVLLKAAEYNTIDENLLDTYDKQLSETGQFIFEARKKFLADFLPLINDQYESIAEKKDDIEIEFESQLHHTGLAKLLQENRARDMYLQRTGIGIHKDDLAIKMNNESFKNIASQGQRKSLLFAMKLAEFITLKQYKGFAPVLLLDDVFEKLDEKRINNLLKKVCVDGDAQVFITDTHKERLEDNFKKLKVSYQLINLLH